MTDYNTVITSIQPENTEAGEKIQTLLENKGVAYTTGINATELFEFDTLLYNIYVINSDCIPEDCLTLIRLLAHSVVEIDMNYEDLVHLKTYMPSVLHSGKNSNKD